jgi:hypothetical protein
MLMKLTIGCNFTTYLPSIVRQPFMTCDVTNVGVSKFCSLNSENPTIFKEKFVNQIFDQFPITSDSSSTNNKTVFTSNLLVRYRATNVLKNISTTYDAFNRDIAMIQIMYPKSTIVQMGIQVQMTWIDYFAAVGGLLGLVLGMGFVSFVELIWLCLRIIARELNLTKWIA